MTRTRPHALLLAAGLGTRFRESAGNAAAEKLLHVVETPSGYVSMGIAAASALQTAGLDVTVVVRPKSPASFAFAANRFATIEAPDAHLGMGHSLAAGVAATGNNVGWLVALADMPYIRPHTIARVADALTQSHDEPCIVVPMHHEQRGHPIAFSHHFADALAQLTGDQGARSIIEAYPTTLRRLAVVDPGILQDIDTA